MVARVWVKGDGELMFNECKVSVLHNEKCSGDELHNSVNLILVNCIVKNGLKL